MDLAYYQNEILVAKKELYRIQKQLEEAQILRDSISSLDIENTKILQIQSEINLLEKTKDKLLEDIESLQNAKGQSFKQYDKQKQGKIDEIVQLEKEGKRLQSLNHIEEKALEDITKKHEEIGRVIDIETKQAEEAVKSIHSQAENRENAVKDREANVTEREIKCRKREEDVRHGLQEAALQTEKNDDTLHKIDSKLKELDSREKETEILLVKNQELLDDMQRNIQQKTSERASLEDDIEKKRVLADNTGKEAKEKIEDVSRVKIELNEKEKMISKKENELKQKELWLEDREATVGRAYRETIKRGGTIK